MSRSAAQQQQRLPSSALGSKTLTSSVATSSNAIQISQQSPQLSVSTDARWAAITMRRGVVVHDLLRGPVDGVATRLYSHGYNNQINISGTITSLTSLLDCRQIVKVSRVTCSSIHYHHIHHY
jgi:hypothetical protein